MDAEIDLKSILGILRRQFWIIVSTVLAVLVIASVAVFAVTPRYTATALVLVDTRDKNLLDTTMVNANASADNARVESEVEILRSDKVLVSVINDQKLVPDPEFGVRSGLKERLFAFLRLPETAAPTGDGLLSKIIRNLRDAISVNRNGLTYLISVGVQSEDPVKAARLANALTDTYIRDQINSKISGTLVARDTLQKRVRAASQDIATNEKSFDDYIDQNLARIEKQSDGSGAIGALRSKLNRVTAARLEELGKLEAGRQALQSGDLDKMTATLANEALLTLKQQRDDLTRKIADAGDGSSRAINLRAELDKVEQSLQTEAESTLNTLQQNVNSYEEQGDALRQEFRSTVLKSNLPPETLTEIYRLQKSGEVARTQYQNLLSRLQDLEAQADLQLPDSRVVSPALAPVDPSFPNKSLVLAVAFVIALGLGLGLAVLREYFIGGFVSESQVEAVLRTPLSTVTPKQISSEDVARTAGFHSVSDLMITAPLSHFSESIRRLRLALDQAERRTLSPPVNGTPRGRMVMISSALPNEGKSTIALSVARAYALSGHRTLLIDCDLRKPSINRHLNLEPNQEFLNFLRAGVGTSGIPSLTTRDPQTNLTVLIGGGRSNVATDEVVMGDNMQRLLSNARRHFDYIVIDTPPVEPVVDGLYLARDADMIVFVVKWATTPQSSAKHAIAALKENKQPGAEILTILNQRDQERLGGDTYAYSGYYVS